MAVTEVHLGCTRGEQLRWLDEAWQSALQLRDEGCDVRAVTVWSLLGSHDWDSLLTKQNGWYEPGPFDTRATHPRPTALAAMTKSLATTGQFDHPVLDGQGWWRKPSRITHPPFRIARTPRSLGHAVRRARPIIVVGSRGTLGAAFTRLSAERGIACTALSRSALDITDPHAIDDVLASLKPWAVINASGYVKVDDAEWDTENCFRINRDGAMNLGARCAALGVHYTTFSSDLVFDGRRGQPYVESDETNPLNVYGASKVAAEKALLSLDAPSLIVRTSAFFGPWDEYNFVTSTLRALEGGNPVHAADDQVVSPTYVPDLVDAVLDLVIDAERGVWHLANAGAVSWSQLARRVAEAAGLDSSMVVGIPSRALNQLARRPAYSALGSSRGSLLPSLDDALARYIAAQPRSATVTQTVNA
jgi:dTDP-4-dehydrorhamnose reductase